MAEDLPSHKLLVKLLNMTTSANDAEALIALRKATEILRREGWDWEKLLAGKIRVVGDPWASIPEPPKPRTDDDLGRRQAPRPQAKPYSPPPPPPPRPTPPPPPSPTIASVRSNNFSGHCYCCGRFVPAASGWIFRPGSTWEVACDPCNKSSAPIPSKRARRQSASTTDILSGL